MNVPLKSDEKSDGVETRMSSAVNLALFLDKA